MLADNITVVPIIYEMTTEFNLIYKNYGNHQNKSSLWSNVKLDYIERLLNIPLYQADYITK